MPASAGACRSATTRRSVPGRSTATPIGWNRCVRLFERGGVRAVFSGHEHNFQHSQHNGIEYFVSGAGSKVRKGRPGGFAKAHTVSWADEAHFLLCTIDGGTMTVRPIGELVDGQLRDVERLTPEGLPATKPISFSR